MSGRDEPQLTPALIVPPTATERLAALEAERARERAAIQDLEADLQKASDGRAQTERYGPSSPRW